MKHATFLPALGGLFFICTLPGMASAQNNSETDDLKAQVQQLRGEVHDLHARLDAQQPPSPATQSVAVVPAATTQESTLPTPAPGLSDQRFLGPYGGWKPDLGFVIKSADDSFLLHPWVFVQARNATSYGSHLGATGGDDTENGFELPRMKIILDGNLFTKDLTYQFIWATTDTTGGLQLQDAWARYHIPKTPFAIEGGQIRNPLDHEQELFATRSLTADRSIVNNVLLNGDDIVKGVELSDGYDDPKAAARGLIAFTSGQRNFDTDFEQYPVNTADWGAAGRVEWKACGDWKDYIQFTALNDKQPLLVFGAGLDYTEAGAAAALTHVIDVQFDDPCGTSFYAAYLGRYTRDDAGPPTTNGQFATGSTGRFDTYDSTVRLMAAQLIGNHFEPFVRYEYIQFDPHEVPTGSRSTVNDFTLGCNYYFYGHRAKFTGDVSYLPNGSPVSNTISDLHATHRGNELLAQIQFQLMI